MRTAHEETLMTKTWYELLDILLEANMITAIVANGNYSANIQRRALAVAESSIDMTIRKILEEQQIPATELVLRWQRIEHKVLAGIEGN